jgi:type III secretion protein V
MEAFLMRLQNFAFASRRYGDIYIATIIVCVIALMIVPIPAFVLDTLIAVNLGISCVLLFMSLYMKSALAFSTFPSLLLVTTLFRLSLNITTTRMILVDGYAGEIIYTFGNFVVAGNFVVGVVIFLIILIVQFIVITKGAERVAEVAARFTLDAMPGKQMSIDADLRAGNMTVKDAQARRNVIEKESQLFGAMDGAMKFVKGDAISSLIITAINIIAGIAIGVAQKGMAIDKAVTTYSILTIGDGLISQIPALLISICAAMIITRAGSDDSGGLGGDIVEQIFAAPKALIIGGIVVFVMGLIPGFPKVQFFILAAVILALGFALQRAAQKTKGRRRIERLHGGGSEGSNASASAPSSGSDDEEDSSTEFSITVPIMLEVDAAVQEHVTAERLNSELVQVRKALYLDLGVPFPGIYLRFNQNLHSGKYQIMLQEVPMSDGVIRPGYLYVRETEENLSLFNIPFEPVERPPDRRTALWVPLASQPRLVEAGIAYMEPPKLLSFHISLVLRRYASDFMGLQETKGLLTRMETEFGELVREVQRVIPPQRIAEVLQRLVQEDISVRNLRLIFQALIEWAPKEKDTLILAEYVRIALRRYISYKFSGGQNILVVYLLEPQTEEAIRKAIRQTSGGSFLALDPATSKKLVDTIKSKVGGALQRERTPVILTSMDIRRFLRKLVELDLPDLPVLSHQELTEEINIQPLGRIGLK